MDSLPISRSDELQATDSDIADLQFDPLKAGPQVSVFPDLVQAVRGTDHELAASLAVDLQAECAELYADIQTRLLQAVEACVRECQESEDSCYSCLSVHADTVVSMVAPTLAKCQAKIGKWATEKFVATSQYVAQLGLPWPEPHEVEAVVNGVSPAAIIDTVRTTIPDTKPVVGGDVTPIEVNDLTPHPATATDVGGNPIPVCPPGYITYVVNGKLTCYKPPTTTDYGEIQTQNPDGTLTPVQTIPPLPDHTGGSGPGGGSGVGTNPVQQTGGDKPGLQICAEGTTVQTAGDCLGEPRPKQVWYVVTCIANGQVQLDTYEGWNPPPVDQSSIMVHGDLSTTQKPTDAAVIAFGAKLCQPAGHDTKPVDKPTERQPIKYCEYSDTALHPPNVSGYTPDGSGSFGHNVITNIAGGLGGAGVGFLLGGPPGAALGALAGFFTTSTTTLTGYAGEFLQFAANVVGKVIAPILPCASDEYATAVAAQVGTGLFAIGGLVPAAVTANISYTQNYYCQYLVPSAEDGHALFTRGWVSEDAWTYLQKINGKCVPWQQKIRDASYLQLNTSEAIQAYRREDLDVDQFRDAMRKAGVKDEDRMDIYRHLAEYIPGPGDLVQMMLRDVEDMNVVNTYRLDDEFEDKWTGRIKDWTTWQGISEDTMRDYWRAHWKWPDPSQLYTMLHRLRDPFILPGTSTTVEPVTVDDVLKVLGINDVAPVWRERLAAISYRIPMRRELGKMYEVGAIDKDELVERYRDLGYTEDDAKVLRDYTVADSAERRAKFQGLPTRALVVKLYKADGLTNQQAQDLLLDAGVDVDAVQGILKNADGERDATNRARMMVALKRRYMSGEYSIDQAIGKMQRYGISTDRIGVIGGQWQEEFSLKRREPTVAQLCDWAGRGYITTDEYMRRLQNLGYDAIDAQRFMTTCATVNGENIIKRAKAAAREAKRVALEESRCRPALKPFCTPPVSHQRTHTVTSVNGRPPTTTDTDSTSVQV